MNLGRRRLLQLGLGGAAVLALGAVGLGLQSTAPRPAPAGLQSLNANEHAILAAIAEAIVQPTAGLPSTDDLEVALSVDKVIATLHPDAQAEFKLGLALLENALVGAVDGRLRPLSRLDVAARAAALDAWRTSRLGLRRKVFRSVQGLVYAAYFGHPSTYAYAGYDGPPAWAQKLRMQDDIRPAPVAPDDAAVPEGAP